VNKRLLFCACILAQIGFLCVMIRSNARILATGTKVLLETVPVDPHDLFRGEYAALRYRISTVEFPPDRAPGRGDPVYVVLAPRGRFWAVESASADRPAETPEGRVIIRGTVQRIRREGVATLGDFADVTERGWLEKHPGSVRDVERITRREADWRPGDTVYIPFVRTRGGAWTPRIWGVANDRRKALSGGFRHAGEEDRVLISATILSAEERCLAEVEYGIESYYVPEGKSRELERPRDGGEVTVEAAVDSSGNAAISRLFIDDAPIDF
jgi:uncharacterized membrane-anchored protein